MCPKCGSTNIKMPPAGMDLKMILPDYCQDCQNRGNFPKLTEYEVGEFRKDCRRRGVLEEKQEERLKKEQEKI